MARRTAHENAERDRRSESRRARHERHLSEDYSVHSSSTDSTRPTVHTTKRVQSRDHVPSSPDSRIGNRQRVPGGAAAKLMLRGPKRSSSMEDNSYNSSMDMDSKDELNEPIDTSEIIDLMNKTKEEFDHGPSRRKEGDDIMKNDNDSVSHFAPEVTMIGDEEIEVEFQMETLPNPGVSIDDESSVEEGPLPAILDRKEAYHENASKAVAALLNPAGVNENGSMLSNHTRGGYKGSKNASVSAFQSPKYQDITSVGSAGQEESVSGDYTGLHKSPTTEPLISEETEDKIDKMSQRLLEPSKTLSDLLRAIASPDDIHEIDRAYMVRRKNACGALKVLTAHNRRRKQICWTVGVLPALTSVLQDAGQGRLEHVYPDIRTRVEYEEARRRAIAALTNLAMPVPNRLAVFHTPGLVQALISNVAKEYGGCLEGSCAVLAYLAKSQENKILMAQIPGLVEAVLRVLRPEMSAEGDTCPKSPNRDYPMSEESDSDCDDDESSVSTEEGRSFASRYSRTSSEEESFDDEGDSFDDDMSTDGESMTGSEASCDSSMSESSGDESGSEYRSIKNRNSSASGVSKHGLKSKPPLSPTSKTKKLYSNYDKDKFISGARKNLFAMMAHLVKEKDNAYRLARVAELVPVVTEIANMQDSPVHVLAVQLLAHLSRHRLNTKMMAFKQQMVVPALVKATYSNSDVSRRYGCFAIQNLSHDKSCRQELASSETLIAALCKRARHSKDPEERLAAICSLKNLTDEPANLIPLSNTPECIATLMQIAHGQEEGVTEIMQFRACDALATISHWLRKIATNGQAMDALKHGGTKAPGMFVPSLKVVGWSQYA